MPAPKIALELISRFDRNLDAYRSGHYNETQVRLEFIDPLFEALGWDIYNKEGIATLRVSPSLQREGARG